MSAPEDISLAAAALEAGALFALRSAGYSAELSSRASQRMASSFLTITGVNGDARATISQFAEEAASINPEEGPK